MMGETSIGLTRSSLPTLLVIVSAWQTGIRPSPSVLKGGGF
jgi:hypothetical protein